MCAIQRVNGQDKSLSAFEQGMVVSSRRTGLSMSRTAKNAAGFFHAKQFSVYIKNGPQPKGNPANLTQLREALESTSASMHVERFRHLVESMPRRIEAVLGSKVGATQY